MLQKKRSQELGEPSGRGNGRSKGAYCVLGSEPQLESPVLNCAVASSS